MQAFQSSEGTLSHQERRRIIQNLDESRRILQNLLPDRASIDDFQDADEAIPAAGASGRNTPQITAHGAVGTPLAVRGSDDTLRDEHSGIVIPGGNGDGYHGSSDINGDDETHGSRVLREMPLGLNSSSTIADVEKQERGTLHTDRAHRASDDSLRDLEKGETGPKEYDQVSRAGFGKRQTPWESNVVGWDGPNDPQNPQNWNKSKKYAVTVIYATMTFCITFASSVFSTGTVATSKHFGVSNEVMTLGTSMFVFVSLYPQHHPSSTDTIDRALPSAQLYGVLYLNSMVESVLSSSDSPSSSSFKYPSLWPKTSKRSCFAASLAVCLAPHPWRL